MEKFYSFRIILEKNVLNILMRIAREIFNIVGK